MVLGGRVGLVGALVGVAVAFKAPIDPFNDSACGVACGLLLMWIATTPATNPLIAGLESSIPRFLGLVSYSVYLWHVPVCWWLRDRNLLFDATPIGYLQNLGLVVAITVALATVTYRLVEKPALDRKARLDRERKASAQVGQ